MQDAALTIYPFVAIRSLGSKIGCAEATTDFSVALKNLPYSARFLATGLTHALRSRMLLFEEMAQIAASPPSAHAWYSPNETSNAKCSKPSISMP